MLAEYGSLASNATSLGSSNGAALTSVEQLGQQIFFDANLSSPAGQSCASCHDPSTAFTEPTISAPVSNGIVPGRTGIRNTPSVVYSIFSPVFHFDSRELIYIGGQFLDGRASSLSEQAKKPFLNPDEMNNASETEVVKKLRTASYAGLFRQIYGGKTPWITSSRPTNTWPMPLRHLKTLLYLTVLHPNTIK